MALFLPPDVPAICEPMMAPLIVTNSVALEFMRDAVRVHVLSRHCLGEGEREFRREAVLCWTLRDFMTARTFARGVNTPTYKRPTLELVTQAH